MNNQINDLKEIREMMEKSSSFLSLSGASGISVGIIGCISGTLAAWKLGSVMITWETLGELSNNQTTALFIFILGVLTLFSAFGAAILFTFLRSKRKQLPLWSFPSRQFLANFFIPLFAGGLLCGALVSHGQYHVIPGLLLVFYGLALFNASKFTHGELKYMGIVNVGLGILTAFYYQFGLIGWILGFGIITAGYGIVMFSKYE